MKFDLRIKLDHPIAEYFSPYARIKYERKKNAVKNSETIISELAKYSTSDTSPYKPYQQWNTLEHKHFFSLMTTSSL